MLYSSLGFRFTLNRWTRKGNMWRREGGESLACSSISKKKLVLIPTYSLLTPKIRGIRCSKMEQDGIRKVDFC